MMTGHCPISLIWGQLVIQFGDSIEKFKNKGIRTIKYSNYVGKYV